MAVWNQINADEVMQMDRYSPSRVHIVGPMQFDAYFHQDAVWTRDQLYERFQLDPARPYLMFATMGFRMDETYWMDLLMEAVEIGQIEGKPQVICRVHPTSHYEHFHRYVKDYPDVRISFIDGYYPALGWTMTREDVIEVSNLLRYAQVLITPASTMTIEAAIFNRPTVVTVFNHYEQKKAKKFFSSLVLGRHFARMRDQNLVPIVERPEDFAATVNRAIREPDWYQDKRQELVKQYVGFTDGRSIQRLADCMASLAK
ncbi:MAG: CDP-glycerol glycerophosphotransferase family protein [Anaerolineae bacterium]|nr:CDP-glycerol glycerophosphotransferase family protein [Anaerolineae bacterium]